MLYSYTQFFRGFVCFMCTAFMLAMPLQTLANIADKQAQFDALYNEILSDPTNIEKNVRYSELAVELGDYEAAIPPLERLLLIHPTSTKIKLELGVLYFHLGSFDTSKQYLSDVKNAPQAKPEFKATADDYLKKM